MTIKDTIPLLYDLEDTPASVLFSDAPAWLPGITCYQLASVADCGTQSGGYMPAVTYWEASRIMADHGDDVMTYLYDFYGDDLPTPPADTSWGGIAVHYLSMAADTWCVRAAEELAEREAHA